MLTSYSPSFLRLRFVLSNSPLDLRLVRSFVRMRIMYLSIYSYILLEDNIKETCRITQGQCYPGSKVIVCIRSHG